MDRVYLDGQSVRQVRSFERLEKTFFSYLTFVSIIASRKLQYERYMHVKVSKSKQMATHV